MAITNILASGSTAASSSDVVVASGAIVTLLCTGAGSLVILQKGASGYRPIGALHGASNEDSSKQVMGPITVQVSRNLGQTAGCDLDDGT